VLSQHTRPMPQGEPALRDTNSGPPGRGRSLIPRHFLAKSRDFATSTVNEFRNFAKARIPLLATAPVGASIGAATLRAGKHPQSFSAWFRARCIDARQSSSFGGEEIGWCFTFRLRRRPRPIIRKVSSKRIVTSAILSVNGEPQRGEVAPPGPSAKKASLKRVPTVGADRLSAGKPRSPVFTLRTHVLKDLPTNFRIV
jgi:hypothetical protein